MPSQKPTSWALAGAEGISRQLWDHCGLRSPKPVLNSEPNVCGSPAAVHNPSADGCSRVLGCALLLQLVELEDNTGLQPKMAPGTLTKTSQ